MWTTKQTQTSNFCFMKDFPILHTQLMARIDDVGKKVQRHWKNTKFIVESTNLKSKMVWRALLELSADTHSQFSPILWTFWPVWYQPSKKAHQNILLFKFLESTMNFESNFVFQCLWTFFYLGNAYYELWGPQRSEALNGSLGGRHLETFLWP